MGDMDNPLLVGVLKGRIAKSISELEKIFKDLVTSQSFDSRIPAQCHSHTSHES